MKNLYVGALALMLAVSFASCKDTQKTAEEGLTEAVTEATEEVTEATEEVTETVTEAVGDVPTFSDPAVQEYVNLYEDYIKDYTAAAESKDMTAFASLGTKGQELATKSQAVMGNLSAGDATKLTKYMTESSKKIQELTAKFTQ